MLEDLFTTSLAIDIGFLTGGLALLEDEKSYELGGLWGLVLVV